MTDFSNPAARLALIERVGPAAYHAELSAAREASVIERVNGRAITPAASRFGRLFAVEGTGFAFGSLEEARAQAAKARPMIDDLAAEYGLWLAGQGLPKMDAEELLFEALSAEQRAWVSAFIARWEAADPR